MARGTGGNLLQATQVELSSLLRSAEAWFPSELSASRLLSALRGQHGLRDQSSSSQPRTETLLVQTLHYSHVCQDKPTEGDSPVLNSMLIASVKSLHSAPDEGQSEYRVETLGTDGTRTGVNVCLPTAPSLSKSTASFFKLHIFYCFMYHNPAKWPSSGHLFYIAFHWLPTSYTVIIHNLKRLCTCELVILSNLMKLIP